MAKLSQKIEDDGDRAVLIGLVTQRQKRPQAEELLAELAELAHSAGAEVIDSILQSRQSADSGTYIGSGLLEELRQRAANDEFNMVIFDDQLTPAQQRNTERALDIKVIDRSRLILDIFATRARTAEAMIQVELAQLQYLLPRLTRAWTHLSRQHGAIGARGPGETQLEVDRRRIGERIARLKEKLKKIGSQRSLRRQRRNNLLKVAFVGYTNSGKSTLFNRLTKAKVPEANKLFMTLDPTSRVMSTPYPCKVLFSDTVGFIRKLPHELVESFKSTLEEAVIADLLIHVVDCADSALEAKVNQTEEILRDIGADCEMIYVYNKVDLNPGFIPPVKGSRLNVVTSAITGQGIDQLREMMIERAKQRPAYA